MGADSVVPADGPPPSELKVLQVLALLSADAAYGGPTTVALEQCRALRALGHGPLLLTGWDGRASAPAGVPTVRRRARMLWRRSFATLLSPLAVLWFLRHCRSFDVVHVHFARDLLSMPLAALAAVLRVPLVLQTHGMVVPDERLVLRLLDRLVTRRVLQRASTVLALTEAEAAQLRVLGVRPDRLAVLGNAVSIPDERAEFAGLAPSVVFLSRLAERKRPVAFVHMAAAVAAVRKDVTFHIWGPDEGELAAVNAAIARHDLGSYCRYRGAAPPNEALQILASAQVLVLPSVAEPFPMVALEALSLGLPAVVTHDTGLSRRMADTRAAMVTNGAPEEMAAAVLELLGSESLWRDVSSAARALARDFAPEEIAGVLVAHYRGAAQGCGPSRCPAEGKR